MENELITGPRRLGPLTPLVGEWEGNVGVDFSYHNEDDETTKTGYFEKAWFKPIPKQENGQQALEGLNYQMTAWRHGEEAMIPFHDEVGYMLWEKSTNTVMRVVVFGRGIAIFAGGTVQALDKEFSLKAMPGDPSFGILQNPYLLKRAELISFDNVFKFNDDGSFTHSSDLVLKLAATGQQMHHTDINTLHLVKRYHPGAQYN